MPGGLVDTPVQPNFRALGKRFGPRTQAVAAAVAGGRPGRAGRRAGPAEGSVTLLAGGAPVQVGPEE